MYMHIFIFYVFVALADSQRFRRIPISTSTYGTSPIVSVTSIPSLSAVASQSASPSDSKTTRPSSSSLPSITPSITQTPSETPSITQTPCALLERKIFPNSQACNGNEEFDENGKIRPNKFLVTFVSMLVYVVFGVVFGVVFWVPTFTQTPHERYNNLNCMLKIIFDIGFIIRLSYYLCIIVLGVMYIDKYNFDETQTIIAACVLAGLWILSVSCSLLVCILTPPPIVLSSDPAPESLNNGSGGSSNDTLNINECSSETGERKDLDLCPICQDNADLPRTTLSCRHSFHTKCINEWNKSCLSGRKIPTCPDCRAVMHTPCRAVIRTPVGGANF